MKSQIVTNPRPPTAIQIDRYHGDNHSWAARPTATTNTKPHTCRDRSSFMRARVLP